MSNENVQISTKEKKTNFWEFWGKISAIIATIAAIIGIINALPDKAISINVYADSTEYYLAPKVKAEILAIKEAKYDDIIKRAVSAELINKKISENEIDNLVYRIKGIIDAGVKFIDANDRYGFEKLYTIDILNNGNKAIEELMLNLKASGYYLVKTASEEYLTGEFKNTINIGKVNAKDHYRVFIWTSFMSEYEKHFYSHKQGAGEIKFPYKVYGIWAVIFEYRVAIIVFMFGTLILICLVNRVIKDEKNKSKEE